jgi:hypothetical protein
MTHRFYLPEKTYIELDKKSNFDAFMKNYIKMLKREFKIVEVKGHGYTYCYYTCGQNHDPRNPNWKPFKILWQLCKKYDYDFFIVKEIIETQIGRKIACECEILTEPRELKRHRLQRTGVDFGEPGRRELDIF